MSKSRSIKTKLVLERRSQGGVVLERREDYSRSFTKSFIDILYVCFAKATNYTGGNSFWGSGQDSLGTDYYQADQLRIASGGGDSALMPSNQAATNNYPITGNVLGILVGADNTAVTPIDQRLKEVFHHGKGAALGAGIQDSGSPADTTQSAIYGASYAYAPSSAGIYPLRGFRATSGQAKMYKTGSPGTCLMELFVNPASSARRIIASGTFDGNALGGTPGALAGATFTTPADIYAGIPYGLRISAPNGNASNTISIRYQGSTNLPRLNASGTTAVFNFTISGTALAELFYGGTSLSNFTASGITVSFDITCLIKNLSGGSAVIKELGISAIGEAGTTSYTKPMPYLIARDVIAPLTLADTESLLVTYTPSITV